jgi:transposase
VLATPTEEVDRSVEVVLGVDTHLDAHVAVAMDRLGRPLGTLCTPTNAGGYRDLVSWAEGFSLLKTAGVEGTGSYGAGLARHLRASGVEVLEVERPKRRREGQEDGRHRYELRRPKTRRERRRGRRRSNPFRQTRSFP